MNLLPFSPLLALALFSSLVGCHADSDRSDSLSVAQTSSQTLKCDWALDHDGKQARFGAHAVLKLGPAPQTIELADEAEAGKTHTNPSAESAETYARAASGVRLLRQGQDDKLSLLIAQDSRRKLAVAAYDIKLQDLSRNPSAAQGLALPKISMTAIDSAEAIATFDDNSRDYASYRKGKKRDFEAMTTLPSGEILVIGSGSEMAKVKKGSASYRSQAHVLSSKGELLASYDLLPFYLHLQANRQLIGDDNEKGPAEINMEGVAIRSGEAGTSINFFHRGNINGNGHNAIVELDFSSWFQTLKATQSLSQADAIARWTTVSPLRIVSIEAPLIKSASDPNGKAFPMTINDALYGFSAGQETLVIPAGVEAEYVDAAGVHHDGEVTFAGMLVWKNIGQTGDGSCKIYQAPGDAEPGQLSTFGKVEGLAAYNPKGKDLFSQSLFHEMALIFGVTDVDSEIKPSQLSVLRLKP